MRDPRIMSDRSNRKAVCGSLVLAFAASLAVACGGDSAATGTGVASTGSQSGSTLSGSASGSPATTGTGVPRSNFDASSSSGSTSGAATTSGTEDNTSGNSGGSSGNPPASGSDMPSGASGEMDSGPDSTMATVDSGSGSTPVGDGGTTSCGFDPVTPNATVQTRKVLCYLHSIYGNHILSGQEEDNNDNGMNTIFAATGKYPAIRSFDVNNSQAPTQCVAHWQKGGLCMFGYHMGINGGTYSSTENIGNVLASGTSENASFKADLDRIASFVDPLQTAGGVAILRLFHEAGQNCNWFWWSKGTSSQWQQLFKYAFDYLTATKGLKNVLWIAPLCGSPTTAYNPGSQYIDFGGADDYATAGDYEPLTNLFKSTENAFPNMMVALHECGSIPDPVQLQSSSTKWLFFSVWASPYFNAPYNPTSHLQEVYSNPYVITRDELPSFK